MWPTTKKETNKKDGEKNYETEKEAVVNKEVATDATCKASTRVVV